MSNITFAQAGNLAFYDRWAPNYVYFNSLLKYANSTSDTIHGTWDWALARVQAKKAVSDAEANTHLRGMSQDESTDYFMKKFEGIISFLEQAIEYERANENAYIDQLYSDLIKSFKPAERKKIRNLHNLEKYLKQGKVSDEVEYDKINTEINALLQGFDNAKTLAQYEQERVQKLQTTLEKIVNSRGNQAAGLGKVAKKSTKEQEEMAERARQRLENKIIVEYATTGQLTRKDSNTGKYIIFGGKTIEDTIPKAIDRVIADWVDKMIDKLKTDHSFIGKISKRLQKNYPREGNFDFLSEEVQEDLIQAVIAYGVGDLSKIIDKTISDELVRDAERRINDVNNQNKDILDRVLKYNITGLDARFGRITKESALFKDAHDIATLKENHAIQLFSTIQKLINTEKAQVRTRTTHSHSYLIEAMEKHKSAIAGTTSMERAEEITALIEEIERLQQEVEKAKKAWNRKIKQSNDASLELQRTASLASNSAATITITIKNGEVTVDQSKLIEELKKNTAFGLKELNAKNLQSTINTLKSRASKILKQEVIESLKKASYIVPEDQLVSHVKNELRSLKIHINGPTLAELLTTVYFSKVGSHLTVDWNKYAGKNDSVAIAVQHGKTVHKFQLTNFYKSLNETSAIKQAEEKIRLAQERVAQEYQATIDAAVKSLTASNDMKKYSKMMDVMSTDIENDHTQDEQLVDAYEELKKETENLKTLLKQELRNREIIGFSAKDVDKMAEEYLKTLQNAFYISTTVKSANDYVNQLGFKGGSLGSTLEAQLNRISDIFESAGVPIAEEDMLWIRSAILNCFPGSIVKEKNKTLIENYLGSLVAFALFDEGGAESAIIQEFQNNIVKSIKEGKARKFVHLYVMDGMYVKGSTVLERTLNTIRDEVLPNIQKIPDTMRKGAGIVIINHASEADIVNRPYREHLNNADPNAWAATGANVENKVSLHILFLAGLLDILNNINATLSTVESI